jgi:hypothetical protein
MTLRDDKQTRADLDGGKVRTEQRRAETRAAVLRAWRMVDEAEGITEVAKRAGCSVTTVQQVMEAEGVDWRPRVNRKGRRSL